MIDKNKSVAHRVLDAVAKIENKQREIVQKHNDLTAQLAALEGITKQVAAFTASEIGKMGGTLQKQVSSLGSATNAIDLNVLALAEVLKEVIGQLIQIDHIFKNFSTTGSKYEFRFRIEEKDIPELKQKSEDKYKELVASSFKLVQDQLEQEDKERQAKEIAETRLAKEAADKAISEEATIQAELKRAHEIERSITTSVSGGTGSSFPKGAQIFGE